MIAEIGQTKNLGKSVQQWDLIDSEMSFDWRLQIDSLKCELDEVKRDREEERRRLRKKAELEHDRGEEFGRNMQTKLTNMRLV